MPQHLRLLPRLRGSLLQEVDVAIEFRLPLVPGCDVLGNDITLLLGSRQLCIALHPVDHLLEIILYLFKAAVPFGAPRLILRKVKLSHIHLVKVFGRVKFQ